MRIGIRLVTVLFVALAALPAARAQNESTAARTLLLSAFGGINGTYTGLSNGRNIGITAGVDLGIYRYRSFDMSVEVRGTYPMDDGGIDAQRNVLGGLHVERRYRNLHPYVDVLFGRGQIVYAGQGYLSPDGTTLYQRTNSNIYGAGGGLDYDIMPYLALKAEVQLEHYNVPVTDNGRIYAKAITVGAVYRFGFNQRHPQ